MNKVSSSVFRGSDNGTPPLPGKCVIAMPFLCVCDVVVVFEVFVINVGGGDGHLGGGTEFRWNV